MTTPTVHEKLSIHELLRTEMTDLQKLRAMMPTIGDEEMHQFMESCVSTCQTHIRALVDFCEKNQLAH